MQRSERLRQVLSTSVPSHQTILSAQRNLLGCFAQYTSSGTVQETEENQLVWPPPRDYILAHPQLKGTQIAEPVAEGRASGSQASSKPNSPDQSEQRKRSVEDLLQARGVKAGTLTKTSLRKLPVDVIRAQLQRWGMDDGGKVKPLLVEEMHRFISEGLDAPGSAMSAKRRRRQGAAVSSPPTPAYMDLFSAEQVASWVVAAKAQDVDIIDVRQICDFAEYMILATGRSHRHVFAAANGIAWQISERAKELLGGQSHHVEGHEGMEWITVDAGNIIVHVFTEEGRRLYDLESLWARPGCVHPVLPGTPVSVEQQRFTQS